METQEGCELRQSLENSRFLCKEKASPSLSRWWPQHTGTRPSRSRWLPAPLRGEQLGRHAEQAVSTVLRITAMDFCDKVCVGGFFFLLIYAPLFKTRRNSLGTTQFQPT